MKQMCKYALVQFMPFVETGEFANVGIIICSPKTGYWDFKLAPAAFARVTDFFKEMDKHVYKVAIKGFVDEMEFTNQYAKTLRNEGMVGFFTEITRPREALLRFSTVRTMLTENPEQVLEALYKKFIHRDFINKKYREDQMVKMLRQQFSTKVTVKYTEQTLSPGFREFRIPLVANEDNNVRLIKPLAFGQSKAAQLFEHGEIWCNRLRALLEDDVMPEHILLPLEKDTKLTGEKKAAYEEIKKLFSQDNFQLVDFTETDRIIEFANDTFH